jgi:hypothetical protein
MKSFRVNHGMVKIDGVTYGTFPKEDVLKKFGTLEQFEKEMKEFTDKFFDFQSEIGHHDREDDWWTDRKGGYEVEYELIKND